MTKLARIVMDALFPERWTLLGVHADCRCYRAAYKWRSSRGRIHWQFTCGKCGDPAPPERMEQATMMQAPKGSSKPASEYPCRDCAGAGWVMEPDTGKDAQCSRCHGTGVDWSRPVPE